MTSTGDRPPPLPPVRPDRWVEPGASRDGKRLLAPRLDTLVWTGLALVTAPLCIPFVPIALLARVPLLFADVRNARPDARPRPGERTLALLGAVSLCVPAGWLVLAASSQQMTLQPVGGVLILLAVTALVGLIATTRHARRLAQLPATLTRWRLALLFAAVRLVGLPILLLLEPTVEVLTIAAWGDGALASLAAAMGVSALRIGGATGRGRAEAFGPGNAAWWTGLEDSYGLFAKTHVGGFVSKGTIDEYEVVVDVLTTSSPPRLTVRVTLKTAAKLMDLEVQARGDGETGIPMGDPIMDRLARVEGVSAETARALLGEAHEELFAVVHRHEDARVGGGCVVAAADLYASDAEPTRVEEVVADALALAKHLDAAAASLPD
jgi:hypothetical protein